MSSFSSAKPSPNPLPASAEAYRQAGVDLDRANQVVDLAKQAAQKTQTRASLLGAIGGFSGAFELPQGYQEPVILAACDGVGTKLKLALLLNQHHSVGIDLVAMNVNDLLANGGEPLVFLDYLATGKIDPTQFDAILSGIAEGCQQAGCALIGGETAEMPGFYSNGMYDLAGFCIGVAEKSKLYPRLSQLKASNASDYVMLGLASSGLHSNGYSLVRKILLEDHSTDLNQMPPGFQTTLAQAVLAPTRIYVKPVLALLKAFPQSVAAMAHITGGGFYDNIPRVLPPDVSVRIEGNAWPRPPIYGFLQQLGQLSNETMLHTFNCGIGFILVVAAADAPAICAFLNQQDSLLNAMPIGRLLATPGQQQVEIG